ncbi:zinc finger BED domain-containing protein RICESLEEPER 2-like [Camellia sinensis]|uniref:zinc finger BED domain-containing protein RICESLEEPER 2-like n=1 Tax=Camellia sinensis TaxID=4442 RepID=UPI001035B9F7|nr:zinc finger BED domain-containing protein RICESLEEPER 2-like [Camellia sinensis]
MRVLNFCNVPPLHTGVIIADALHKCLVEWGIENKVATITVDNASYNDVALRVLKENFAIKKKLPLGRKLFHVRCCAHILNIMVQYGLSEIGDIVDGVCEGVKYLVALEVRLLQFNEIVKQLQLPSKKLILDCPTRWNGAYMMMATTLEFKDVFPRYQERDLGFIYVSSLEDWIKVENVCQFLAIFNEVTNIISGSDYPTSNLFLTEVWKIKEILNEKSVDDNEYIRAMTLKMKVKFDKYWGECNLLMAMATVLDPRYKMMLIDFCFQEIYLEVEATRNISMVCEALYELYNEYVSIHTASNTEKSFLHNTRVTGSSSSMQGVGKSVVTGKSKFESFVRKADTIQPVKSDLVIYLEEGVYICNKDSDSYFDALKWWKVNNLKFRILSKMACDILSVPITSVASESTFSVGGRVIDPYRASLSTETVQILLCGAD